MSQDVAIDAPLVFVGYGITAPEYDWNDYTLDVTGKVLLCATPQINYGMEFNRITTAQVVVSFVNDPPATAQEPDLFRGEELTYYGRWTYKQGSAKALNFYQEIL